MDLKKTGLFISGIRKEKSMTQKELAERLSVTDKAVSRWETGKGFPDVSILKNLSEVLGVSITEIVNGEKAEHENIGEKSDNAVIAALSYSKNMSRKAIGVLLLSFGLCLAVFPVLFAGRSGFSILSLLGIAAAITAIVMLSYKKPFFKDVGKAMKISRHSAGTASLVALASAIILEALPYGAVLIFSSGPEKRIKETFSYFSLTPFGYANFSPFLTAILTVLAAVLSVAAIIKRLRAPRLQNAAFICTVIALICSVVPFLMFGTAYMSAVGAAITILLLASLIFQALSNREVK